jgi:hypothetical protein
MNMNMNMEEQEQQQPFKRPKIEDNNLLSTPCKNVNTSTSSMTQEKLNFESSQNDGHNGHNSHKNNTNNNIDGFNNSNSGDGSHINSNSGDGSGEHINVNININTNDPINDTACILDENMEQKDNANFKIGQDDTQNQMESSCDDGNGNVESLVNINDNGAQETTKFGINQDTNKDKDSDNNDINVNNSTSSTSSTSSKPNNYNMIPNETIESGNVNNLQKGNNCDNLIEAACQDDDCVSQGFSCDVDMDSDSDDETINLCDDEDIHDFGLPLSQPQSLDQPLAQPQLQDQLNADTVLEVKTANLSRSDTPDSGNPNEESDCAIRDSRVVLKSIQDMMTKNPMFCSQHRRNDWNNEINDILSNSAPKTIVGVLGNTGVGKVCNVTNEYECDYELITIISMLVLIVYYF